MGFDLEAVDYRPTGFHATTELQAAVGHPEPQARGVSKGPRLLLFSLVLGVAAALGVVVIGLTIIIANNTDSALYISIPALAFAGALIFLSGIGAVVYPSFVRNRLKAPDAPDVSKV